MNYRDLVLLIAILGAMVFGFRPALKNFKVVRDEKPGARISPRMRIFVLLWFGLGIACMVFMSIFSIYRIWLEVEKGMF